MLYRVVVQLVLLFVLETCIKNLHIEKTLGIFHHWVAHSLTWRKPRRGQEIVWVYTPLEDAMSEARLQEVKTYVSRLQNTVTQFIATRPIMDLCMAAERRPE